MPDPADAYQRSIDQAAKIYGSASESYNAVKVQLDKIAANPTDIGAGGPREAEYGALTKQLSEAQRRFNEAEKAYQDAIQLQDKARATAKELAPKGETRQKLDTTSGNVLVSVTEIADGRGGWSVDPATPPKRVDIPGVSGAVTAAPTSEYILRDGKLERNEAYKPPAPPPGSAVPTSEYVYDSSGKPVSNTAYRPPNAEINTSAEYINDPEHPGQLIKNRNYRAPAPPPMTAGQTAVDTATASTAEGVAQANLSKAKSDADKAQIDLENARRLARQAPNDQQAQHAIDTAQQQLDLAVQQQQAAFDQLKKINPIAADQAAATLTATRQNIEKNKLGDLYGLQDRIKQVRDLIALGPKNGGITPEDGDAMIAATQRGTTVFDVMKQTAAERSTARSQDVQNADSMTRPFGQIFTQGLTEMSDLNKYAAVGSSAGADAFVALMNMAQDRLKQYAVPPATPTDYLGPSSPMSGLVNAAQQQVASAPPVVTPAAPGSTTAPITINIGGASTQQPSVAPWTNPRPPETAEQSTLRNQAPAVPDAALQSGGGLARAASTSTMATPEDVLAAYPGAAARHGYAV